MTNDQGWAPPIGSVEVEPGCWQTADSTVYVDPVVWEGWERDLQTRAARARAHEERCRIRHAAPTIADHRDALDGALNANHDLVAENDALVARVAFVEDILRAVLAER